MLSDSSSENASPATGDGLEVIFRYAHHSNMLSDLNGLIALRSVCDEVGIARYCESPETRGWSPTTPSHTLVSPSTNITGQHHVTSMEGGDGDQMITEEVVSTDLSALAAAFDRVQPSDIPSRNITSREGHGRHREPRKPQTPEVLTSRLQLSMEERAAADTLASRPMHSGISGRVPVPPDDYEYHRRSTQGAALQAVFSHAMREQAHARLINAKTQPSPLAAIDSAEGIAPLHGLRLLHSACVAIRAAESYRLPQLQPTSWNNTVSKHQRERLVMNMSSMRPRGYPGVPLAPNPLIATAPAATARPPMQPTPPQERPRKRLNTAARISRKANQLRSSLDHVKAMIDLRTSQHHHQQSVDGGSLSTRARRLKAFAETLPRPSHTRNQERNPKQRPDATTTTNTLPAITTKPGTSESVRATDAGLGGTHGSGNGVVLPSIRSSQTAGNGNNITGSRLAGATSHASELLRQLQERNASPTNSPRGAAPAAGPTTSNPLPTADFEATNASTTASGKPYLKRVKHRFMSGPTVPHSQASAAHTAAVARKLML